MDDQEVYDAKLCKERHNGLMARLRAVTWMLGFFLAGSSVAITYMVIAYTKAADISSTIAVMKVQRDNDYREMMAEIQRAQVRADERLATAIMEVGYQRSAQLTDISYKIDGLAKKIDDIQKTGVDKK